MLRIAFWFHAEPVIMKYLTWLSSAQLSDWPPAKLQYRSYLADVNIPRRNETKDAHTNGLNDTDRLSISEDVSAMSAANLCLNRLAASAKLC